MNSLKSIVLIALVWGCTSNKNIAEQKVHINTSTENFTTPFKIEFIKGEAFNHPSFAFWIEDLEGNYIETLFVTQYVGSGKFGHGEIESGKWKNEPDYVRRPASLPYWAHKRNIQAPDGLYVPSAETPVPDGITGATPQTDFVLDSGTKINPDKKFRVLFEINQAWDSNKFWTNDKFPDDKDYFTSLQPALVYAVTIDLNSEEKEYFLNPIGHGHPAGKNGKLYTDLTTITTAKNISEKIVVRLK